MSWNYAGSLKDCGFLSTLLPISPLALAHSHLKEGKEKETPSLQIHIHVIQYRYRSNVKYNTRAPAPGFSV